MSSRRSLKTWEQRISRQTQFYPGHMSGRVDSAQPVRRLGGTVRRPWIGQRGGPAAGPSITYQLWPTGSPDTPISWWEGARPPGSTGDLWVFATNIFTPSLIGYGYPTMPGWTLASDADYGCVLWAPASDAAWEGLITGGGAGDIYPPPVDSGSMIIATLPGCDLADPIQDVASVVPVSQPVTECDRAMVACNSGTAWALHFAFFRANYFDSVLGAGVDTATGLGAATVLVDVVSPDSGSNGILALAEASPAGSAPSWSATPDLLHCGTPGDYHSNLSVAVMGT